MSQFDPAGREYVKERVGAHDYVADVNECGNGLMVVYRNQKNTIRSYTNMVEQAGWYVASYEVKDSGDVAVLMPVTEVR